MNCVLVVNVTYLPYDVIKLINVILSTINLFRECSVLC